MSKKLVNFGTLLDRPFHRRGGGNPLYQLHFSLESFGPKSPLPYYKIQLLFFLSDICGLEYGHHDIEVGRLDGEAPKFDQC